MNFCGTLELDGGFKYTGEKIEIKGKSLVVVLSEYLNTDNNNLKNYVEKYEAKDLLQKIEKFEKNKGKEDPKIFQSKIKNYITINKESIKDNIEKSKDKLKEMANKQINSDKHIFIDTNDLVLIENKREYPHHMSNEVRNFIPFILLNCIKI